MSGERDINKAVAVATTVAVQAALTATTTGAAVDLVGFRSAMVAVIIGTVTDGTFVATLEESDASGSGFTTVAAGNLSGSFTDIVAGQSDTVQEVGYLGQKRYIRLVLTESVASAGALIAAVVIRGNPVTLPQ